MACLVTVSPCLVLSRDAQVRHGDYSSNQERQRAPPSQPIPLRPARYCVRLSARPIPSRSSSNKIGSAFRKVGKYLKEQASEQPHTALYLGPASKEPQPRPTIWTYNHQNPSNEDYQNQLFQKLTVLNGYIEPPPYGVVAEHPSLTTSRATTMTSASATGPGIFQSMIRHQYASDNILQSYDVLQPEHSTDTGIWLVYIHGGYFRDPKVDSTSFKPAISQIESPETPLSQGLRNKIAGYASLNYRLSLHPAYPQDPASTPPYTLRNARWPDQPKDILSALSHLQRTYPASKDYILLGHSVGATLAFLATLSVKSHGITPPKAVVGVSGIYDFPAIHQSNPDYEPMTRNGMEEKFYREASPALYDAQDYLDKWDVEADQQRVLLIAHSKDDELVNWEQPEEMVSIFGQSKGFKKELLELYGAHNSIWEKGGELVRTIEKAVGMMQSS